MHRNAITIGDRTSGYHSWKSSSGAKPCVPFFGGFAKATPVHAPCVADLKTHQGGATGVASGGCPAGRAEISRADRQRGQTRSERGVMLAPVPVLPSPPLVDALLRHVAAHVSFVVHDGHLREVAHLPAGA